MNGIHGLCFSVGQDPAVVEAALKTARRDTSVIRTYSPEPDWYVRIALQLGFDIVPTAWLADDPKLHGQNLIDLIDAVHRYGHKLAIVGNEMLMRKAYSPTPLPISEDLVIEYMRYVRKCVPHTCKVTTAEDATFLMGAPKLVRECDVIGMHHYPYGHGVPVELALQHFIETYNALKSMAPHKEIVVLETGWPSDGEVSGEAVPSVENARRYFRELAWWAMREGVRIFWFSAYNEKWKIEVEGPHGAHWGIRECPRSDRKYWHS